MSKKKLEISVENTYEWFKKVLLDIHEHRELVISQAIEMKQLHDAWVKVNYKKNIERMMWTISEYATIWYHILHEANTKFPEIMKDEELNALESTEFDPYAEERKEMREAMDKQAREDIIKLSATAKPFIPEEDEWK